MKVKEYIISWKQKEPNLPERHGLKSLTDVKEKLNCEKGLRLFLLLTFKSLGWHSRCWVLTKNQLLDNQILQLQLVGGGILFPLRSHKTLYNSRMATPEKYKKSINHSVHGCCTFETSVNKIKQLGCYTSVYFFPCCLRYLEHR